MSERAKTSAAPLAAWLEETRRWTEGELERALAEGLRGPARLDEAVRYAVFGGGKRLRPAIVRLVCTELGGCDAAAAAPAVAIELVHTYSLVHDDLPCMDDDDLRRGRATCHRAFDEATAVLVGDGLQTLAFEWLAREGGGHAAELVAVLAAGAGLAGMVGGQALDVAARAGDAVERVREIHGRKTAALVAAAAELGVLAAGERAPSGARRQMRAWGEALGRCFQAVDDVLDVTGDARTLGKTPGKDAAGEKATLVAALGLEGARREAERLADEACAAATAAGCPPGGRALALVEHLLRRRA